jgi:5-formyltetrahydrofolate cyclo-ligase
MDTGKHGSDEMKMKLRSEFQGVLKNLSLAKREGYSAKVRTLLLQQPFWKSAATILFFAPLPNEADAWPLLAEALTDRKIAALPRFDSKSQSYVACRVQNLHGEIVKGRFGIREPDAVCEKIQSSKLDLILVPGVAFDLCGHRLGRGKGFYDRLLAGLSGIKCGIAFDEQIAEKVPAGTLDVRMDFILTPTRLVRVAD